MKIQAFMPVFNEADVLPYVLAHLRGQGVLVHVLDGWSTDGSYEIAKATPGVTVERFPAEGQSAEWACRPTLRRIEDLAAASDADWCMLNDADEWRRSNRPGETLAEGIARIDAAGYNVIDHEVFQFYCTDANWTGDPEYYFRYFDQRDLISRIAQEKIWKNVGRVNLVDRGGHVVKFDGKRIAPEKFVMKHYPFRTPEQAKRKLQTRLDRRCHEEHKAGWGVHYDQFKPGFPFLWPTDGLLEWPMVPLSDYSPARSFDGVACR